MIIWPLCNNLSPAFPSSWELALAALTALQDLAGSQATRKSRVEVWWGELVKLLINSLFPVAEMYRDSNLQLSFKCSTSPLTEVSGKFTELDRRMLFLFSRWVVSNYLWPHGLQHIRLPCPAPSPWACSNSCPLSQWCHPTISSSVAASPPALSLSHHQGLFPVSQLFTSGGQSIGTSTSASVLPMNIQGWFPLRLTGLISLQSKGLSRVSLALQ